MRMQEKRETEAKRIDPLFRDRYGFTDELLNQLLLWNARIKHSVARVLWDWLPKKIGGGQLGVVRTCLEA